MAWQRSWELYTHSYSVIRSRCCRICIPSVAYQTGFGTRTEASILPIGDRSLWDQYMGRSTCFQQLVGYLDYVLIIWLLFINLNVRISFCHICALYAAAPPPPTRSVSVSAWPIQSAYLAQRVFTSRDPHRRAQCAPEIKDMFAKLTLGFIYVSAYYMFHG